MSILDKNIKIKNINLDINKWIYFELVTSKPVKCKNTFI